MEDLDTDDEDHAVDTPPLPRDGCRHGPNAAPRERARSPGPEPRRGRLLGGGWRVAGRRGQFGVLSFGLLGDHRWRIDRTVPRQYAPPSHALAVAVNDASELAGVAAGPSDVRAVGKPQRRELRLVRRWSPRRANSVRPGGSAPTPWPGQRRGTHV